MRRLVRPRNRRGVTLLDVAVATALLSVVLVLAIQVVISLSGSTQESLSRANARRQAVLATTTIERDFAAATPCLPPPASGVLASRVETISDVTLAFYAKGSNANGPDLIAYRVNAAGLSRATAPWEGQCPQVDDLGEFAPLLLAAQPVRPTEDTPVPPPALGAFTNGLLVTAPQCTTTTVDCMVDTLSVDLVAFPPGAGPQTVRVYTSTG